MTTVLVNCLGFMGSFLEGMASCHIASRWGDSHVAARERARALAATDIEAKWASADEEKMALTHTLTLEHTFLQRLFRRRSRRHAHPSLIMYRPLDAQKMFLP